MKLKISRWTPKQSPDNLGCSCVEVNCLVVFQNLFSFFYPFFKPLKISLKFTFTPTLIHNSPIPPPTNLKSSNEIARLQLCQIMHQSIPAVHIPPSPGNRGAFPDVARPEGGAFVYLRLTPRHLTRGFETVE